MEQNRVLSEEVKKLLGLDYWQETSGGACFGGESEDVAALRSLKQVARNLHTEDQEPIEPCENY